MGLVNRVSPIFPLSALHSCRGCGALLASGCAIKRDLLK
jgi:hypothetical protein